MLYLKKLTLSDGVETYEMLQEILENDNGFHNSVNGMTYSRFRVWLETEYARDNGKLENWMVPQSSYWLMNGGIPVGYGRIRHYLNDHLRETSGHIGYAIRESERGKGYGNEILRLLLNECAQLGITEVQVGANKDNALSNKVILSNGGILFEQSVSKNFYLFHIATRENDRENHDNTGDMR